MTAALAMDGMRAAATSADLDLETMMKERR